MATISIVKTKTGLRWQVKIRNKTANFSKTFTTAAAANEFAAQHDHSINKALTVADLITRYATEHNLTTRQQRHFKPFLALIGNKPAAKLDVGMLAAVKTKLLAKNIKPATVNRYFNSMRAVCTVATNEWQSLPNNPCQKIKKLKEPQGRLRTLTDSERQLLLQHCKASSSPELYTAVYLALSTGMRKGELLTLQWQQIDFTKATCLLEKTKNDNRRKVHLTPGCLAALNTLPKINQNVFQVNDLRKPFATALRKANIADFRWHDLRHDFASKLANNGASTITLMTALGHKSPTMAARYAHLTENTLKSIITNIFE